MHLARLSRLLLGPPSKGTNPFLWPLFSSSSPFQPEPLALPLIPTLPSSPSTLRLWDPLPGLCLPYHRPPSSIRHGLLSLVTLLYPTSACLLLLRLLLVFCSCFRPGHLNMEAQSCWSFHLPYLRCCLSSLKRGLVVVRLVAWRHAMAKPYFTSQMTLCPHLSPNYCLVSASTLSPGYCNGLLASPYFLAHLPLQLYPA